MIIWHIQWVCEVSPIWTTNLAAIQLDKTRLSWYICEIVLEIAREWLTRSLLAGKDRGLGKHIYLKGCLQVSYCDVWTESTGTDHVEVRWKWYDGLITQVESVLCWKSKIRSLEKITTAQIRAFLTGRWTGNTSNWRGFRGKTRALKRCLNTPENCMLNC